MNLPFPSHSNRLFQNYSFILEVSEGVLQTGVWTIANGKVSVLAVGSYEKYLAGSDFVSAADSSLSQALSNLKIDPASVKNVIFGLPSSWLFQDKILPEKTKFLKDVCRQLSLKPIGFVITAEAVVRYLHTVEGVPSTAILVGISDFNLEVTVVRLGRIIGIHTVKRGENIAEDVKEGLSRFLPADLFPSRILLYDHGVELESIRQTLLSYAWQAPQHRLPFIHFPKIDILPRDFAITAISVTTGAEAAKSAVSSPSTFSAHDSLKIEPDTADLGFVEDIDLALQPSVPESSPLVLPAKKINFQLPSLPKLLAPRFVFVLFLLLFLISAPVMYWYRFVTARVVLTFTPQTISTRFAGNLPVSTITAEAETEVSLPATGSVLVGDKAVGSVTVINGTNIAKSFPSGTQLISDNGLKFLTTEPVMVASASGTADPNSYQPGKAEVKVVAENIGQESNLSAGSEFKIGSFSKLDYVARNNAAFSGGNSRQVQAVSKKDLADARAQADADLGSKAEAVIRNSLPEGAVLIDGSITQKVISETANHQEGEETVQLTLVKKIKVEGKVYQKSDLDKLVDEKLLPLYPPGSKPLSNPKTEVVFTKTTVSVQASVDLAPDIDTDKLSQQLLGKPVSAAELAFKSLPGLSGYTIEFQPKNMNLFKRFPYRPKNLSLFSSYSHP